MPYSGSDFSSVPLKSLSPNLISNNLAVGRGRLVYGHSKGASTVTHGGREAEVTYSKIETKDIAYTMTVRTCYGSGDSVIIIGSSAGLQMWNSTGQLMLLNFEHAGTSDDSIMWHVSAAAGMKPTASEADAVVAAGTSVGEILIFAVDTSTGRAKYISTTTSGQHSITAMGSITDTSRGSTASDFMVTGDDAGAVKLWKYGGPSSVTESCSRQGGDYGPVVGLGMRGGKVLVAFSAGVVQILSQDSLQPEVELFAHSRLLSAMDVHPTKDIFATVAEDATLNVFKIPQKENLQDAGPLLSICWPSVMLTGVAFCGPESDDVATLGWDNDELRIFKGR